MKIIQLTEKTETAGRITSRKARQNKQVNEKISEEKDINMSTTQKHKVNSKSKLYVSRFRRLSKTR